MNTDRGMFRDCCTLEKNKHIDQDSQERTGHSSWCHPAEERSFRSPRPLQMATERRRDAIQRAGQGEALEVAVEEVLEVAAPEALALARLRGDLDRLR